ncbi:MAG TPA: glycosyltransferase [Syntrophomonadaceae bacterium]|nr:glycosyltransferase [Syntrophomonadaceae bacterium]
MPGAKPKVMLHYIMPPKTSGPNTSMQRIESSWLHDNFEFGRLVQDERPGKFLNIRLLRKMIAQVKAFRPDLIHLSGLQNAAFYGVLAARIGGCRNILTAVRGSATEAIGINKAAQLLFRYLIEPITMRMSCAVYTVCEDMAGKFGIAKRNNYVGVIYNAAPIIIPGEYARDDFRNEIDARPDDVLVAVVGRMTYDKGISYIIDAIKSGCHEKAIFVFVGDGPYCEILERQLELELTVGRVHVLGKRSDVLRILAGCDMFLFATLHENLSNALLEACSMGLAIIATAVGGNPEVICDNVNGLLVPSGDSAAIVKSINHLCENGEERKRLGKAAQKTIEEKFSQQKVYGQINDLYKDLIY